MITAKTTIRWGGDDFLRAFMEPGTGARDRGLTAAAMVLQTTIKRGMGSNHGGKPSVPGAYPNTQSNDFRQSLNVRPGMNGAAHVWSNSPYAKMLQKGGTIRPRTAKHLCWPVHRDAKLAVRRTAGNVGAAIQAMKTTGRIYTVGTARGFVVLRAKRNGRSGKSDLMFVGARSVRILPRPWATLGVRDAAKPMTDAFVREARKTMLEAGSVVKP